MMVKLDNANLTVECGCECGCKATEILGPLDWSWDYVDGVDEICINGEIEGMGFEDIGGRWVCERCATKVKENHG